MVNDLKEKNDREALNTLMKKYKNTVFNVCFRYCGNLEDASDISQDVFIKVYRNIGSFRGKSKFSTWLYRLTLNTCHNYRRHFISERLDKMSRIAPDPDEHTLPSFILPEMVPDPEKVLLNKELSGIIDMAVSHLNKKQRSVIILRDFQGRSYEEIADILKMKTGTVKSTLARGRLQVARKIKTYYQS